MKRNALGFISAITLVLASCISKNSIDQKAIDTSEFLDFTLTASKDVYKIDEPVLVLLSITNISDFTITIKKRMSANSWSESVSRRDISFFIIRLPSGDHSSYSLRSHTDPVTNSDFIDLFAGETVEQEHNLSALYNLEEYGTYSASAVYQNTSEPSNGKTAWRGELVSNTILFEITP